MPCDEDGVVNQTLDVIVRGPQTEVCVTEVEIRTAPTLRHAEGRQECGCCRAGKQKTRARRRG
jgi:hypothetical protein